MKNLKVVLLVILLAGCTALETLGDYVNDNALITSITVRQVVGRYIAAGDTVEIERKRAVKVEDTLSKALNYLNGEPLSTVSGLLIVVNNAINWEDLETYDKILIMDILAVLKTELETYQTEHKLSLDSQIAIKALFETAVSTANIYMAR